MIRISDNKQGIFFDPWDFLNPKRRKMLDQSWAGLFQKELLCELPVREMAPFFTDGFGHPTKELHTVLGALIPAIESSREPSPGPEEFLAEALCSINLSDFEVTEKATILSYPQGHEPIWTKSKRRAGTLHRLIPSTPSNVRIRKSVR